MKRLLLKLLSLFMIVSPLFIGSTNAYFSSKTSLDSNTFTLGYWLPPTLVYPPNNYVAVFGSDWLMNPYMDWDFVKHGSNVRYIYESSHSPNLNPETGSFTNPVYVSGLLSNTFIPAQNTPNGIYYWHVKAIVDGQHHTPWSEVWKLTVNNIPPPNPDIVINEVLFDVPSLMGDENQNEWVELYNNTATPISLKNWRLQSNTETYTIHADVSIPPHGFAYLSHDASTWNTWSRESNSVHFNLGGQKKEWLSSQGSLRLLSPALVEIDYVAWNNYDNWDLTASEGQSIRRKVDGSDAYNDERDWESASPNAAATLTLMAAFIPQPSSLNAQIISKSLGHITLRVQNLPDNYASIPTSYSYEIIYNGKNGLEKGINGTVNPAKVVNGVFEGDLFLGTCSGSVCTPDLGTPPYLYLNIYEGSKPIVDNQFFSL
ncbi:MAG: lamin tail domain-containing protein [Patescibacteria group bacterium]|jgi:predicted ribosomally synthesized peptide with SipW-like signal peptide